MTRKVTLRGLYSAVDVTVEMRKGACTGQQKWGLRQAFPWRMQLYAGCLRDTRLNTPSDAPRRTAIIFPPI